MLIDNRGVCIMKNKVLLPILTCLFLVLFSATVFVSYSGNIVTKEVVLKRIIRTQVKKTIVSKI